MTKFIPAPVKVARAYEELAGVIRDRIISGELREGDRLPSEAELASQAGVSRSTVREALRMLQEAGFIERSSPKIMVVRGHRDEPAHHELIRALRRRNVTFHHLHEALLVIEPELARHAAGRRDAEDVKVLEENLRAQGDNLGNFSEWNRLDEEFHLTIAEMSANPALIIARMPMTQLLLPTLNRFIDSERMTAAASRYHEKILDAVREGDGESAALIVRRHVNDFRKAWETAGLDFHIQIGQMTKDDFPKARGEASQSSEPDSVPTAT